MHLDLLSIPQSGGKIFVSLVCHWSVFFLVQFILSQNLSACNLPIARTEKLLYGGCCMVEHQLRLCLYDDFVKWAAHQTLFSVAFISLDPGIGAASQTKDAVTRTQRTLTLRGYDIMCSLIFGWLNLTRISSPFRIIFAIRSELPHDVIIR